MVRTTAHLSRRLGIDATGTLRWQDTDSRHYVADGLRYHNTFSLQLHSQAPSTMPFAPNDFDQPQPAAPVRSYNEEFEAEDLHRAPPVTLLEKVLVVTSALLTVVLMGALLLWTSFFPRK